MNNRFQLLKVTLLSLFDKNSIIFLLPSNRQFGSLVIVVIVVVAWKGIHSRSNTNRTGAEGLSFYYPRLL